MTIYFIGGDFDAVKIGYTEQRAAYRFDAIQTGNHETLRILAECSGGIADEHALHKHFQCCRIRSRGEWFRRTDEVNRLIHHVIARGTLSDFGIRNPKREQRSGPAFFRFVGLEKWRKRKGLTEWQAAKLLGVFICTYSAWEKGRTARANRVEQVLKLTGGAIQAIPSLRGLPRKAAA